MLWTIMPLEAVLDGMENYSPKYCEVPYGKGRMLIEAAGGNTARVVRVISSDPQDYLTIQPGIVVNYRHLNQD